MRLLIVEDDPTFARTLARALCNRGHETTVAQDASGAQAQARAAAPDAVILDRDLGNACGLDLVEPLLAVAPDARILILTGYASIGSAVTATKRGAFNYLAKPANVDEILAALDDDQPHAAVDPPSLRRLEHEHIQRVLDAHQGNVSAAARALGLHRRTLQRKLAKRPASR